ncbi:MAG: two-component system sensor histidine kinase NtrB [Bryobacteraceae bacterium]
MRAGKSRAGGLEGHLRPTGPPHTTSEVTGAGLATSKSSVWRRWIRPQDLVWLLLFAGLSLASVDPHPFEIPLLAALALLQIVEPRVPIFQSTRGTVAAILLKLLLSYVLIGFTGGVASSYYLLLLIPLLSASTAFGAAGSIFFTLVACGAYLSFVVFAYWYGYQIDPDQQREIMRRLIVFAATGYLSNTLITETREQSRQHKAVAEQLAIANRNLSEAEDAVRRSDRLAALGQLSAGLAHELRNPLGTIKASAEVLSKSLSAESDVAREMAGFISSEVDRTNLLVTRFLDFARPLQLRVAPADIAEIIDRAVAQLERGSPRYDVAVYKNYSPEIPALAIDGELIERVIYNLLLNAAQATAPGGEITVKTRASGAGVEIAVIDRGAGIDSKDRNSIFNPFFTTKAGGVGLGLAIVSKIVDEHGGKMSVESESGKGSVFRVLLQPVQT